MNLIQFINDSIIGQLSVGNRQPNLSINRLQFFSIDLTLLLLRVRIATTQTTIYCIKILNNSVSFLIKRNHLFSFFFKRYALNSYSSYTGIMLSDLCWYIYLYPLEFIPPLPPPPIHPSIFFLFDKFVTCDCSCTVCEMESMP